MMNYNNYEALKCDKCRMLDRGEEGQDSDVDIPSFQQFIILTLFLWRISFIAKMIQMLQQETERIFITVMIEVRDF